MQAVLVSTLSLAGKKMMIEIIKEIYTKMKETKHPKVQTLLSHLDLQSDLKVIQALVEEISIKELEEGQYDVVDVALEQVKDMMILIKDELEKIQIEINNHESKYFAEYREPNFNINLNHLIENKIILDKRVDLLIKLIMMKEFHSLASTISESSKYSSVASKDIPLVGILGNSLSYTKLDSSSSTEEIIPDGDELSVSG